MRVLVLSPYPDGILGALSESSDDYIVTTRPVDRDFCLKEGVEFLVSYGYRHILKRDLLSEYQCRAINLHISLLPYCRGAHPVFWSILEGKPLGATIHLLDEGLDTGNILIQSRIESDISPTDTFSSLHKSLTKKVEGMFSDSWKYLRTGESSGWKQRGESTYHKCKDLDLWQGHLPDSWDTLIIDFCRSAKIRYAPDNHCGYLGDE